VRRLLWSVSAVIAVTVLVVGVWQFWPRGGPGKLPERADLGGPKSGGEQPKTLDNGARMALQTRALTVAKAELKARETWYKEASFEKPIVRSDGTAAVWVLRIPRQGQRPEDGGIVHLELDKNGKVVSYRHEPL
jgi:hypothetical protein